MADRAGHLSDDELAALDETGPQGSARRDHVRACEACRQRCEESLRLRELLAATGRGELRPPRDAVPSAMMRLRLRRHSVMNTNELLEGFAALMRGLASLFSLPAPDQGFRGRPRGVEDEPHE